MTDKDYKAFIVEGEAREPNIINNIAKRFFSKGNIEIITLPAGENIYMLWKKLKDDDFETDVIEVLREGNEEIRKQLEGLSRDDFSEVYLFFDYDAHQNNLGKDDEGDAVAQMLKGFDNETENGKLYISYPMVEALRDYVPGECGEPKNCFVALDTMGDYKSLSSERSPKPMLGKYDINTWKEIIDVFAMRVSCLYKSSAVMDYHWYCDHVSPSGIYDLEAQNAHAKGVFVLSAFPEFLVDYFGEKLWKTSVKHTKNKRNFEKMCSDT